MKTVPAKKLIHPMKAPSMWFGADYTLNIYRGCSHGCIYCDSRSDCYHVDHFDTVHVKEEALQKIRNELACKRKAGVISTGAMSDPYNPLEEKLELTRHSLELMSAYGFGVFLTTKAALMARDKDVLREIAQFSPVLLAFTITTADDILCKKIEKNVSVTSERLEAMAILSNEGLVTGALMTPLLPWINDTEENIGQILEDVKAAGGKFVYSSFGLTMRDGQREFFYDGLDQEFPELRSSYEKRYGLRYQCSSPRAKILAKFFQEKCTQLGLLYEMPAIIHLYRGKYKNEPISFF